MVAYSSDNSRAICRDKVRLFSFLIHCVLFVMVRRCWVSAVKPCYWLENSARYIEPNGTESNGIFRWWRVLEQAHRNRPVSENRSTIAYLTKGLFSC